MSWHLLKLELLACRFQSTFALFKYDLFKGKRYTKYHKKSLQESEKRFKGEKGMLYKKAFPFHITLNSKEITGECSENVKANKVVILLRVLKWFIFLD